MQKVHAHTNRHPGCRKRAGQVLFPLTRHGSEGVQASRQGHALSVLRRALSPAGRERAAPGPLFPGLSAVRVESDNILKIIVSFSGRAISIHLDIFLIQAEISKDMRFNYQNPAASGPLRITVTAPRVQDHFRFQVTQLLP